MSTRAEKLLKAQKDRHHTILRELVQELPNKTCADCLSKGPRWASWNLGVFVCIRCAGIHRNLGVHISKVKSIDLDSWTVDQIENFLKWGNKRAALYYECYLPKDFTRPQGNQAVETFIRNKYEKKLYIKKDGEPEANPSGRHMEKLKGVSTTTEKENKPTSSRRKERPETKHEDKPAEKTILNIAKKAVVPEVTATVEEPAKLSVTPHHVKSSSMNDLMSMSNDASQQVSKPSATTDDLLNFGAFTDPVPQSDPVQTHNLNDIVIDKTSSEMPTNDTAKSAKESILSLYSTGSNNQQKMYGVPGGVYMQQQQMPQQGNMMYGYPQQAMPNQMNQMNTQMQQMNLEANKQMLMAHHQQQQQQSHPYNQQGVPMNQFGSSGQPTFATPMYTSNSNMMANQMNSVYQHQNFQTSSNIQNRAQPIMAPNNAAGNYANAMGQRTMAANVGWTGNEQQNMMGMMNNQQSSMGNNNSQAGHFNMNSNMNSGHMMNGNTGFTMNNQLWN